MMPLVALEVDDPFGLDPRGLDLCGIGVSAGRSAADSSSHAEPLSFVLERLPHIRCYTLSVCGAHGALLTSAHALVTDAVLSIHCTLQPDEHDVEQVSRCCLRLELGEALDGLDGNSDGIGIECTISDGYAYVRVSLAALPPSDDDSALGHRALGASVPALSEGRESQQLREEAGLYHRAAQQRRSERLSLRGVSLGCRCGCAAPLVDIYDPRGACTWRGGQPTCIRQAGHPRRGSQLEAGRQHEVGRSA